MNTTDMLSTRVKSMAESATLAMAAKGRELRSQGIDIVSLSLGEPDFKTPDHVREAAKGAIDEGKYFAYPPVTGYPDLREAIADKLKRDNGLEVTPNQIVVSNGAKQSISNVMLCLLDPGDEVVIYTPYWVSYADIVKMAGGTPVFISAGIEDDFKATAQQLADAITPRTKAVLFSSPSNPTGSVFTREELEAMAEVIKQHENLLVISDEIYEYINFTGGHVSIGALPGMAERTVTVNGFSKGFAMTGWRVGYIAAPEWLAKATSKIQGQLTSGNCSIAQRAALAATLEDMEPTRAMAAAYLKRRDMMIELLREIPGIKTNIPQGAFYIMPDISAYLGKSHNGTTIETASDFSMYLLNQAHVSVVTGDAFGAPGTVRISYAASDDDLREAVKRIKEAVALLQ